MACGCNGAKRRLRGTPDEIIGYRVTLPNGAVIPPVDEAPFFSMIEARAEVRRNGGGTAEPIKRGDG